MTRGLLVEEQARESVPLSHPHRRGVGTADSARAGAAIPAMTPIVRSEAMKRIEGFGLGSADDIRIKFSHVGAPGQLHRPDQLRF